MSELRPWGERPWCSKLVRRNGYCSPEFFQGCFTSLATRMLLPVSRRSRSHLPCSAQARLLLEQLLKCPREGRGGRVAAHVHDVTFFSLAVLLSYTGVTSSGIQAMFFTSGFAQHPARELLRTKCLYVLTPGVFINPIQTLFMYLKSYKSGLKLCSGLVTDKSLPNIDIRREWSGSG